MARKQYENVVVVTRRTELDELVARFNTRSQAKFYLEHAGADFDAVAAAHEQHQRVLSMVRRAIPGGVRSQLLDREMVPRFSFGAEDLVVTVGQDGLVSNTAKYLSGQPILAINPDPARYDGPLLSFRAETFPGDLYATLSGRLHAREVTLAQAETSDGQSLLAFNDFFIGASSHVSARYRISVGGQSEEQSSSGVIVSTGAGSTGWLQSVYAGAAGVIRALGGTVTPPPNGGRLPWDTHTLIFAVREPFPSNTTETSLVYGTIDADHPLEMVSHMATNGLIFSDGVESDTVAFNAGTTLRVTPAAHRARLIVPAGEAA